MATSDLDRLYSLLTAKVGFSRVRDVRLEKIAADRALEMRHQQGLSFEAGEAIVHQIDQLKARTYPWQSEPRATENATWHYYPPTWVDPIAAAVDATLPDGTTVGWWNSPIHHQQLVNPAYTTWGHGIYFEDVQGGARRWYFITVFAADMAALTPHNVTLQPGTHIGLHLTTDGQIISRTNKKIATPTTATVDDRMQVPGRGAMVHLVGKPLGTRWIADGPLVEWWP